jgi:hypothetical protein
MPPLWLTHLRTHVSSLAHHPWVLCTGKQGRHFHHPRYPPALLAGRARPSSAHRLTAQLWQAVCTTRRLSLTVQTHLRETERSSRKSDKNNSTTATRPYSNNKTVRLGSFLFWTYGTLISYNDDWKRKTSGHVLRRQRLRIQRWPRPLSIRTQHLSVQRHCNRRSIHTSATKFAAVLS